MILMITLCSCKAEVKYDVTKGIYERYSGIKSYAATLEVSVKSNLSDNKYEARQYYKAPSMYLMEGVSPEEVAGTRYVFANGSMSLSSPAGKGAVYENYVPSDMSYTFLPDFFALYYNSLDTAVSAAADLSGEQTILEVALNGKNIYRFSQKLWIDSKTLLPSKMETYDVNGNAALTVIFKDFKLNENIDDSMFAQGRLQ